jgi:hypothetical protein
MTAAGRTLRRLDRAQARRPMRWVYCFTYHSFGSLGRVEIMFDQKIATIEHVATIETNIARSRLHPSVVALGWQLLRVEPMPDHSHVPGVQCPFLGCTWTGTPAAT